MITKNNQRRTQHGLNTMTKRAKLHMVCARHGPSVSPTPHSSLAAALEAVAHRQDDDEDERDDDAQDDQLDLHVLEPHLSPHLGALLSEILCLQTGFFFQNFRKLHVGRLACFH